MSLIKTGINGIAWTTISIVIRSVVSLLQITILTRFLEKEDFGIMAIATVFIGFTQIFLDLGISIGIMHKQDITPKEYSSLFWFNIIMGVLLTAMLCTISPLVANFYHEPSLMRILMLLSLSLLFSSFGSQHRTIQQKLMRFKYISIVEIITMLLSFGLAVFWATHEYGVYTLVYTALFNALFSNVVFLCIGMYKDRNISFHFKLSETYPFLKIGVYNIGSRTLDYFSDEIDTIIISKVFGMEILGAYNLCKKIIMMLFSIVNQILVKVMTPIFATLQNNVDTMKKGLYDVIESTALFNFFIYSLVAIFSTGILKYLYGPAFIDNNVMLSIMSLYYGYLCCISVSSCVQIAMGRTDVALYWTIIRIMVNALAVLLGSLISVVWVVVALFVSNILVSHINWIITVKPLIGGEFLDFIMKILKPFAHSLVITMPLYLIFRNTTSISVMIVGAIMFFVLYSGMIWLKYKDSFFVNGLLTQLFIIIKRRV